jgi:hypothetical protein
MNRDRGRERPVARRDRVVELLQWQEAGCRMSASPSPFYAALLAHMAHSAERDGPVVGLLARTPLTIESAGPLRLLGGVHRAVLDGDLPQLAAHWPGDTDAAWRELAAVLEAPPATVLDALERDPQTNEVGRSAALAAGLAEIARRTGLPVRLFEIGSSAGLNLRLDRYCYRAGGQEWGDAMSTVRFAGDAYEGVPPFAVGASIVERRGCDVHPIDATTRDGRNRLLSYVWPDQVERQARLRAALEIAANVPVTIDTQSADDWVDACVHLQPGTVTVVAHSIMWQYLPAAVQQRVIATLDARGAAATPDAPLARLRLEPAPKVVYADLRLTSWPRGDDEVLATSGYHGPPVRWLLP